MVMSQASKGLFFCSWLAIKSIVIEICYLVRETSHSYDVTSKQRNRNQKKQKTTTTTENRCR